MNQESFQQIMASIKTSCQQVWLDANTYIKATRHSHDIIGLVILYPFLKILKLRIIKNAVFIEHCALIPLPENSIAPTPVLEILDQVALTHAIETAFSQLNITTTEVACALNRSSALIKTFPISAALTPEEIEQKAWFETNRLFPQLVDEIYIDFYATDTNAKTHLRDIVLVACRKDKMQPYLDIARLANLKLQILDINSYALTRALNVIMPNYPQIKIFALLNIDFFSISLVVANANELIYSYETHYNGNGLLRYCSNLSAANSAQSTTSAPQSPDESSTINDELNTHLGSYIANTMQFFYSSRANIRIEEVFISGDAVYCIPGVAGFISSKIAKNTIIANPFSSMRLNSNQQNLSDYASTMMLACGLALSNTHASIQLSANEMGI